MNRPVLLFLSLMLSILMWVSFSGRTEQNEGETLSRLLQVPLIYRNEPQLMRLVVDEYQTQVSVEGSKDEIARLGSSDIQVELDLKDYEADTYRIALSPQNVTISPNFASIRVVKVVPEVVELTLESLTIKRLPIQLSTIGRPAPKHELVEVVLDPENVEVRGPTDLVKGLDFLVAKQVDISGLSSDVEGRVRFDFDRQVPKDTVILGLNNLRYRVIIREKRRSQAFPGPFPVEVPQVQGLTYTTSPESVGLRLEGPISAMDWVNPEWLAPTVTIDRQQEDDGTYVLETTWAIPLEVMQQTPNWEMLRDKLKVSWLPEKVSLNSTVQRN